MVVFQDHFTKYVEAQPLRTATGPTIVAALEKLVLNRWGCPRYLLTDNGTEFLNRYMTAQLSQYGVRQTNVPPYHAQANPVERVSRTLKTMMISYIGDNHQMWDAHLPELCFALNTAVQASTQKTPAFLNFGRNPRPAKSIRNQIPPPTVEDRTDPAVWKKRMTRLPLIHDWVH